MGALSSLAQEKQDENEEIGENSRIFHLIASMFDCAARAK
jgi:hypothetical protein